MTLGFTDLAGYIEKYDEVWVTLNTQINICLVGVENPEEQIFIGKYLPCVPNAREHSVRHNRIDKIHELKSSEEANE